MPGVAGQLVRVLAAPRPMANGTYTVRISLHPESLGTVQATVTGGSTRLSVQLVATTNDGAEALRQSLPELREALSATGPQATVTVSGGGSQGSAGAGTGQTSDAFGSGAQHLGQDSRQGPGGGTGPTSSSPSAVPIAAPDLATATSLSGTRAEGRLLDVHV